MWSRCLLSAWCTSMPIPRMRSWFSERLEGGAVWRCALLFAVVIGLLGVLPHALFSLNSGGVHYMSNAWDEDSYTGYAIAHHDVLYRTLSATILRQSIAGLGLDGALIAIDGVVPFMAALLAMAVVFSIGFRTRQSLVLGSCLLLFALNFLALCNASMVGPYVTQILPFSSFFYPDWFRMFVPNSYENFFSLYKSPEPQVTLLVQFLVFYVLLRHAKYQRGRDAILLALLTIIFPYIYVSNAIALMVGMALYAGMGFGLTRQKPYLPVAAITAMASIYYVHCFNDGALNAAVESFVFASRLPILSASMLWGGILLWVYARHWGRNLFTRAWARQCPPTVILAIACCLVPWVTLNQQVLTGQMVQSRTWEYYANMPFIAFAMLLLWPWLVMVFASRMPARLVRHRYMLVPGVMLLLVVSQVGNFAKYTKGNMDNLAVAEALQQLRGDYPDGLPAVILERTGDDSQVRLRYGAPLNIIAGYQQTITDSVARLEEGDARYEASRAELNMHAFTYFDHLGVTPEQLQQRMQDAASSAMGAIEVAYFFSYLDCWKPLSDFRAQNVAGMQEKIPSIMAQYRAFLADPARRNGFGEVLFVTRNPHASRADAPWHETVLTTRTRGYYKPVTITIYRDVPLGKKPRKA